MRPLRLCLSLLLTAGLACNLPGTGRPDTAATLNAAVSQTVAAGGGPVLPTPESTQPAPAATAARGDTPTVTLIPTQADVVVPTLTTTATLRDPTRPNGPAIHAPHRASAPAIDGDLGDWSSLPHVVDHVVYQPANWTGADDNSAVFAVAWDASSLYVAVQVVDDVHVQTQTDQTIFRGDSVEVLLDVDLRGDHSLGLLNVDDYQLGFSPGGTPSGNPQMQPYLWFPAARAGRPDGVVMAVQLTATGGYRLEAAIPWSLFSARPATGDLYGFALSVSDNDTAGTAEQQSMISVVPTRRLTDPTTWSTLVLDGP